MLEAPAKQAAQDAPVVTVFNEGDYVLYRDPDLYWAGEPDHTFPCRITKDWSTAYGIRHTLSGLTNGRTIRHADPAYMRLLPPADAMHDIDSAALNDNEIFTPAAIAWMRQQYPATPAQN